MFDVNEFLGFVESIRTLRTERDKLESECKRKDEQIRTLTTQQKWERDASISREGTLRDQIEFMRRIVQGVFKDCEACRGEGGFGVDIGEGYDFESCSNCLGTGVKLLSKQEAEPSADLSPERLEILKLVKELDPGRGAIIEVVANGDAEKKALVTQMLKEGTLFEVLPGRIKILE